MKLRNKESGEIGYFCFANWNNPVLIIMDKDGVQLAKYTSLDALNAEWEDVPKEYWFISDRCKVFRTEDAGGVIGKERKSFGNYFESKEEAELAVEKLKAVKRLKDKGFKLGMDLSGVYDTTMIYGIKITASEYNEVDDETRADLDLFFGGEE